MRYRIIPSDLKYRNDRRLVPLAKKLRQNMTRAEVVLWQELHQKKLGYDFDRQKPIDQYIVDFYCKALCLAIEIDGITHYNEEAFLKDEQRENNLKKLGVSVLRFDDDMVLTDMDNVLRSIRFWIEEHTPS